jgi:lysophospholipase L1-like esterase
LCLALLLTETGLRVAGLALAPHAGSEPPPRAELALPAEARPYRILALGESMTVWSSRPWPAQLERILNGRARQRRYQVFNEGRVASNTAFILAKLARNLDRYAPDMVITMMGINDGSLAFRFEETPSPWRGIGGIRLVKLGQWIAEGLRSRCDPFPTVGAAGSGKVMLAQSSEEYRQLCARAHELRRHNRLGDALAAYEAAMRVDPLAIEAYLRASELYEAGREWADVERVLLQLLQLAPPLYEASVAHLRLGRAFKALGRDAGYVRCLYRQFGLPFLADHERSSAEITVHHYRKLYEQLRARGIAYVAVQYPTLDTEFLSRIFADDPGVSVVENKRNFDRVLAERPYEEVFSDRFAWWSEGPFAGRYGHPTELGERMIAENVANAILARVEVAR